MAGNGSDFRRRQPDGSDLGINGVARPFTPAPSSQPRLLRSRQPIRFWDSLGRRFAEADVTAGAWPVGQLQHGLKLVCRSQAGALRAELHAHNPNYIYFKSI